MTRMSKIESTFIKWFSWIAGSLSVIIISGAFTFYVSAQKFQVVDEAEDKAITERINYVERMHKSDISNMHTALDEIKTGQRDMLNTQKEILKLIK